MVWFSWWRWGDNTGGSSLALEDRLHRVTTNDIARVSPEDVARMKQRMTPEDLQMAMHVMLTDNRYAEVIRSASPPALHAAVSGLTPAHPHLLGAVAKSNLLALYNTLQGATEEHLMEVKAIYESEL